MAITDEQVKDIEFLSQPAELADGIVQLWTTWKGDRSSWENEKRELRDYLFATDTTKTSNSSLPWKNSTTMPKLSQIRDNLHANYLQALFPHEDWFVWQPANKDEADKEKARRIVAYMKDKLNRSNFRDQVARLLLDYIDYGNAFAEAGYVAKLHDSGEDTVSIYHGPVIYRVSPFDIVFNITANSFQETPKITRSLVTLGSLQKAADTNPAFHWAKDAVALGTKLRADLREYPETDVNKHSGLAVDGFGQVTTYLNSGTVELLEFEGDIYDPISKQMLLGHRIIVMDRKFVVLKEPFKSWLGTSSKEHVGWRLRPDNLMAMGPLDNLVGMQYRIDHLENLKADVFDQIAHPIVVKKGYVEDFEFGPGAEVSVGEDADINFLRPDSTALNAEFQIANLMDTMEEMAGAPKQAMGIRTPGEKTAFEVSTLENAASRIFQNKITWFEQNLLEPLLNQMLEQARRNLDVEEAVPVINNEFGVKEFLTITRKDLESKGKLVPRGARHFARKNQLAQNLMGLANSAIYQDPGVQTHISGLGLAEAIEELLDIDRFELVRKNIRVSEAMETQQAQTSAVELQTRELADANAIADDAALAAEEEPLA